MKQYDHCSAYLTVKC